VHRADAAACHQGRTKSGGTKVGSLSGDLSIVLPDSSMYHYTLGYKVALVSRIDKAIGLFCKRDL